MVCPIANPQWMKVQLRVAQGRVLGREGGPHTMLGPGQFCRIIYER